MNDNTMQAVAVLDEDDNDFDLPATVGEGPWLPAAKPAKGPGSTGLPTEVYNHHLHQALNAIPAHEGGRNCPDTLRVRAAIVAEFEAMQPADCIEAGICEGIITAQSVMADYARRASFSVGSDRDALLDRWGRMSRYATALRDSLDRHRGKGRQHVTVEHLYATNVNNGAQAVIGGMPSKAAGGDTKK